ncbi:MAG: ABC transporter permease, partial [Deltaproteobacteria bacterium]|nr:ABC transporter permease [Deltaproteobacteria bacterium]
MPLIKIIFRSIGRNKTRSLLTVCSIAIAIIVFGIMRTFISAWYAGADAASATRLVTRNAISIIFPLPLSYKERIRCIEGVKTVSYASWFGGVYIDERNMFPNFAVDGASFLDLYSEFIIPPEQRADFLADRKGAVAGKKIVERFGWKIGDTIVLKSMIFSSSMEFTLRAVYQGRDRSVDETQFLFHWEYLNEKVKDIFPSEANMVGCYMISISHPDLATTVKQAIDAGFQNSRAETLTETEKAFNMEFIAMSDAIIKTIHIVSFFVLFIILAVVANTMVMVGRERSTEFATMRILGFTYRHIATIIFGETFTLALVGCGLGILLTIPICDVIGKALANFVPVF